MPISTPTLPICTEDDFRPAGQLYQDSPRWLPLGSNPPTWLRFLIVRDWYLLNDRTQEEMLWTDARLAGLSYQYGATGIGPQHPDASDLLSFERLDPLNPSVGRVSPPAVSLCGEAFAVPFEGFQNRWNNEFFVYTPLQRHMLIEQGRLTGPVVRRFPGFANASFNLEHAGMYYRDTWITAICEIFVYLPELQVVLLLHDPHSSGRPAFEAWTVTQTEHLTNVVVPLTVAPHSFHAVHMLPPLGFTPPLVQAWHAVGEAQGLTRHDWLERDFAGLLLAQLVSFRGGPVEWDMSTELEGPQTDWDAADEDVAMRSHEGERDD
ncbi:hypothetical protein CALVIDRAFT_562586 [Calocera viscosa TUFC12733]|uniref:Uncharacterized protein n=1 Tax=Calocera viscosa (strain TUFC12733) TaxID=1330018 RepID=A0A167NGC1_CALVF|nr:hypothetical protein CALVIDRAFT_562586 [Calocera viscosa TUFC12733]